MDQAGKLRKDVHIASGELREKTTTRWENGEDLMITVLSGLGESVAVSMRAAPK